jgi:hypothetical protein
MDLRAEDLARLGASIFKQFANVYEFRRLSRVLEGIEESHPYFQKDA